MKIAHNMPLNIKTYLFNTKKIYFVSGKPSPDFDNTHITVPEGPPFLTPYKKANIRDGYVIPQESKLYSYQKSMNDSGNKTGWAQFTLMSKLMRNLTTRSVESCSKRIKQA